MEKISYKLIPEPAGKVDEKKKIEIDERLMATPAVALNRCRIMTEEMAALSAEALYTAVGLFDHYDADAAELIRTCEDEADRYEDALGSYLVKLSDCNLAPDDSHEATKLLHMIGELERISDHAVNILESVEETRAKDVNFSETARQELKIMLAAVTECVEMAVRVFRVNDLETAVRVEPLEEVVDVLKGQLRSTHILRMQRGECTIEAGFIWSDLLTDLERVADHCSNIAGLTLELARQGLNIHGYLDSVRRESEEYSLIYREYADKYL